MYIYILLYIFNILGVTHDLKREHNTNVCTFIIYNIQRLLRKTEGYKKKKKNKPEKGKTVLHYVR